MNKENIKYLVGPRFDFKNFAGSKFPNDTAKICSSMGIETVELDERYYRNSFQNFIPQLNSLLKIKRGSTVLYIDQVSPRMTRHLLFHITNMHDIKIISLLEDIDVLRYEKFKNNEKKEFELLNSCSAVITQTDKEIEFLKKKGITARMISMGALDYLTSAETEFRKRDRSIVCYGGNLTDSQSGFIYKLPEISDLKFFIYGKNQSREIDNKNVFYKGEIDAEKPDELEGGWGLCWNGRELYEEKDDLLSQYYSYVCPHKFSMYLSAGIPVIVSKTSAMAGFVQKNKCGIVVRDLMEMPSVIVGISDSEYQELAQSAFHIGEKMRRGEYTRAVVENFNKVTP